MADDERDDSELGGNGDELGIEIVSGIQHNHSIFYEWCFRCQLSRDEENEYRNSGTMGYGQD